MRGSNFGCNPVSSRAQPCEHARKWAPALIRRLKTVRSIVVDKLTVAQATRAASGKPAGGAEMGAAASRQKARQEGMSGTPMMPIESCKKFVMGEATSLGARATLPALASVSALLDAAWKAALPGRARLGVGEEAHHTGAAVDLFAQALEPVGALPVLVVRPWQACLRRQAMDGESPLAVPTRPNRQALGTYLAMSRSRKLKSRRASCTSLRSDRPAQLLQAVVVGLAGQGECQALRRKCT